MPSGDVITRFVPLLATATKRLLPNATEFQEFASAADLAVHETPSGDVITRFVPLLATATNRLLP
jgi:hypothetical protein